MRHWFELAEEAGLEKQEERGSDQYTDRILFTLSLMHMVLIKMTAWLTANNVMANGQP